MRLNSLIINEIRFLFKYGIIFLYVVFTIVYLCILAMLPKNAIEMTEVILVFTDPAAMGLYFMGAVVLLEKSQRVESSLGISPIKTSEYVFSKVITFMLVGIAVSGVLSVFAGTKSIALVLLGVALSSILFSLCGILLGTKAKTLSGFMALSLPLEVFICAPAIISLFGLMKSSLWVLHPGIAAIQLIRADSANWMLSTLSLVIWIIPIYIACKKASARSLRTMGGARL